jgi:hypothetical protein
MGGFFHHWIGLDWIGWGIFAIGWWSKMISIHLMPTQRELYHWMDGWMGDQKISSSSIIWWNKIIVQLFHLKNQRFPLPKRWGSSLVSNNMSTRERNKEG